MSCFSEIIVLDTGSTDHTIDILNELNVTLYQSDWKGYAKSKKECFSYANQPWIFWLDADEVLTEPFLEDLINKFNNLKNEEGFEINRKVYFEEKWISHGCWFPDWNLRIFKRNSWQMKEKKVHESVQVNGKVGKINSFIEHHSFTSWQDLSDKSNKYARLWAEQKYNEGKKTSLLSSYIHSAWAFTQSFLLKKGFLDGVIGFKISLCKARETLLKYKFLIKKYSFDN